MIRQCSQSRFTDARTFILRSRFYLFSKTNTPLLKSAGDISKLTSSPGLMPGTLFRCLNGTLANNR
tara:strand:- start:5 stop:202 length:198 start_codon:yes stop_codon:yes gene_type:complete